MEKIKRIPISAYLYLGYLLTVVLFLFFINARFGDDAVLFEVYAGKNILNEVISRYNSWSSRVFIDGVMIFLATRRFLYWKVATLVLMGTLPYFLTKAVGGDEYAKRLTILLVSAYPMLDMASCGWISCSINYIWPLWCLVFVGFLLKRCDEKKRINPILWAIGALALVFGASHELVAVYMLVILGIFIYKSLYQKSKLPVMVWVLLVLNILELILILVSPANGERSAKEADIYIAGFNDYSVFFKLGLGIMNVIRVFVAEFNMLFVALFLILAGVVFLKTESWAKSLLALMPLGINAGYIISPHLVQKNYIGYTENALSFLWAPIEELSIKPMPIIYFIIIVVSVVLSFYWITEDVRSTIYGAIIAGIGMATAVIMGFSPTVYASENRPFIFLNFTLIYLGVWVFNHIGEKYEKGDNYVKTAIRLFLVVLFTAALSNCLTTVMLGKLA